MVTRMGGMSDMNDAPAASTGPLPPELRFLKTLVTVLMVTMILGLITIVALLVIRLNAPAPAPLLPAKIALPDGARAEAVTMGKGWVAVVTDRGQILIYDGETGLLRQMVDVTP